MNDHPVSLLTVASTALWGVALLLIAASIVADTEPTWGHLGVLAGCAGATLNVRQFFCQLQQRERDAYELGQASVRPIRR